MIITAKIHHNISINALIEKAVKKEGAILANNGALSVTTGKYTGRSPHDRFIVKDSITSHTVDWGAINIPYSQKNFILLYKKIMSYINSLDEVFVFDGFAGADRRYSLPIRIINEFAYQNLFSHQLFIRAKKGVKLHRPQFTVIAAPGCEASPGLHGTNSEAFVIINFKKRVVIIGGTKYCGEIKKSVFSVMNYLLPNKNIFPMHCSANIGKDNSTALFFGLSGTGKTTLSADPERKLIGDDEHGWSDNGIFNFEGGCYAKCIGLRKEKEPEIYAAIRHGSIMENVVLDSNGNPDFSDSSITENTRVAYPLAYIPHAKRSGTGSYPKTVIFLTADAFGVIPPISRLSPEQAMYYFLSGYTSKLAGTERGISSPVPAFSACFGAPFMTRKPMVYANMLRKRMKSHKTSVFMINTGWTGGPYGTGKRIDIALTRAMVKAALNGDLDDGRYRKHNIFNLQMPVSCPGVPPEILDPESTWKDRKAYVREAKKLSLLFRKNFRKFKGIQKEVIDSEPKYT